MKDRSASPDSPPALARPAGWLARRRGDLLAVAVLAAMTCGVFWKGLIDPASICQGDAAYLYQDYYTMAAHEVRAGRLPLWNPYILMGVPFHASLQPGLFYPLRWPAFWMDYPHGYVLLLCVHYFLGAVAAYLFVRACVGVGPAAGALAAMSIAFGGLALGHASHPNYFLAYPWFFGAVLCVWLAIQRRRWRWVPPAGLCVGLMALIGAVHLLLVLGVLLGTLAAYYTALAVKDRIVGRAGWVELARPAACLAGAVALGAVLGAVQLLPAGALSKTSVRQEASWQFVNMAVAHWEWNSLQMVVPFYFGNMRLGYWNELSYDEMAHYAGAVTLVLAAAGLFALRRDRHLWALVVLAATGFLLGAGDSLPVYRVFYDLLPPFRQLRNPTRIFWLADIALACLAAVGVERVLGRRLEAQPLRRARRAVLAVGGVMLVVLAGALVKLHGYAQDPAGAESLIRDNPKIHQDQWFSVRLKDARTGPKRMFQGDGPTWLGVGAIVASLAAGAWLVLRTRPIGPAAKGLLVALLGVDLLAVSFGMIMYNHQFALMRAPPAWASWLGEHLGYRRYARILKGVETSLDLGDRDRGMSLGFRNVGGLGGGIVDSMPRSQFVALASGPVPINTPAGPRESWEPLSRMKDLAAVRYYLFERPIEPPAELGLRPVEVHWGEDRFAVYENPSCPPGAFFVRAVRQVAPGAGLAAAFYPQIDPRQTALVYDPPPGETAQSKATRMEVTQIQTVPGRWEIHTDTDAPAQLVISEGWDGNDSTGWRCRIAGREVRVFRTYDQILSVPVPAGKNVVVLRYEPPSFRTGLAVTITGAVLAAGLIVLGAVLPRRARADSHQGLGEPGDSKDRPRRGKAPARRRR